MNRGKSFQYLWHLQMPLGQTKIASLVLHLQGDVDGAPHLTEHAKRGTGLDFLPRDERPLSLHSGRSRCLQTAALVAVAISNSRKLLLSCELSDCCVLCGP